MCGRAGSHLRQPQEDIVDSLTHAWACARTPVELVVVTPISPGEGGRGVVAALTDSGVARVTEAAPVHPQGVASCSSLG